VIPKRRVVERTISWLEKCRRLWKNCERKLSSSLAMIRFAFIFHPPQKISNRFLGHALDDERLFLGALGG
jgi:hypothetical protein